MILSQSLVKLIIPLSLRFCFFSNSLTLLESVSVLLNKLWPPKPKPKGFHLKSLGQEMEEVKYRGTRHKAGRGGRDLWFSMEPLNTKSWILSFLYFNLVKKERERTETVSGQQHLSWEMETETCHERQEGVAKQVCARTHSCPACYILFCTGRDRLCLNTGVICQAQN